jgi:hypothetical protein
MEAIPDIPEEIDIQLQRGKFIGLKLIKKVPDTKSHLDFQDAAEPVPILPNYPSNTSPKTKQMKKKPIAHVKPRLTNFNIGDQSSDNIII